MTRHSRFGDLWLFAGLILYAISNVIGVQLAIHGIVWPPWGILEFFTFVGPLFGLLAVGVLETLCKKRPFSFAAVLGFVSAMLVAACINWLVYGAAVAGV